MDAPTRRSTWHRWLIAHAAVVVACTVLLWLIVVATPPEAGFNFGVVFAALPLLLLGLPWSAPGFFGDPYALDGLPIALRSVIEFGPAWLNLALHGALFWFVSRRRGHRSGSAPGLPQG